MNSEPAPRIVTGAYRIWEGIFTSTLHVMFDLFIFESQGFKFIKYLTDHNKFLTNKSTKHNNCNDYMVYLLYLTFSTSTLNYTGWTGKGVGLNDKTSQLLRDQGHLINLSIKIKDTLVKKKL